MKVRELIKSLLDACHSLDDKVEVRMLKRTDIDSPSSAAFQSPIMGVCMAREKIVRIAFWSDTLTKVPLMD
jgi:hypothetical protein